MGKNEDTSKKTTSSYVGAPYNFIPFSEVKSVYAAADQLPAHNSMENDLISGEIEYEMTAQTPIFTDDGNEHFHKDANGRYSIPGSSIRGLIRNNVQILGCASFNDDIDDYALMYRDVTNTEKANGNRAAKYDDILGVKDGKPMNVKAGYIKKEGETYFIYPTNAKGEYYTLSEKTIQEDYADSQEQNKVFSYPYFKEPGGWKTQSNLDYAFQVVKGEKGENHYIGVNNENYKPYFEAISYVVEKDKVKKVGLPGKYLKSGYVISSGKIEEKKAIYILPGINIEASEVKKSRFKILEDSMAAFRIDYQRKENMLGDAKEFFDLPKNGQLKPVFYLKHEGQTYFGFTPRLRIFYKHKIKEGLPNSQKGKSIDYAKAIFGYSSDQKGYKSRVSFSDAVLSGGDEYERNEVSVILSEPKPTSYMDYLVQNHGFANYGLEHFELRGVKQYWLHEKPVSSKSELEKGEENKKKENKDVASTLRPLPKGVKFTGKVRFKNLTEKELGLLLWAIRLEKNSWTNIGKAKSFGYGCVSVQITSAKRINYEKAYNIQSMLNLTPFEQLDVDQMIDCYKKIVAEWGEVEKSHISDFFKMKDSTKIPNEEDIRYMSIANSEYQSRKEPLPSIDEVIKKRKR